MGEVKRLKYKVLDCPLTKTRDGHRYQLVDSAWLRRTAKKKVLKLREMGYSAFVKGCSVNIHGQDTAPWGIYARKRR